MYDEIALRIAKEITSNDQVYNSYTLVEKMFIIMPLTHSEVVRNCEYAVKLLNKQIEVANSRQLADVAKQFVAMHKSAKYSIKILKAFGRFPHRNKVLGRQNKVSEDKYFHTDDIEQSLSPSPLPRQQNAFYVPMKSKTLTLDSKLLSANQATIQKLDISSETPRRFKNMVDFYSDV